MAGTTAGRTTPPPRKPLTLDALPTVTERAWHTLDAIAHGTEFVVVDDDRMVITYRVGTGEQAWEVSGEDLDVLAEKGWIDLGDAERVVVTAAGRYWLGRWARANRTR